MRNAKIICGDCLLEMPKLAENSVNSIVTDPPYGLSFMGKDWDHGVPGEHFWREAIRVAKPGAYLLAFGGTRTFHRLTVAIEDAGWEIRDCVMWVYGSGFPKSHDVSKGIDKAAGAEREIIGTKIRTTHKEGTAYAWAGNKDTGVCHNTVPNTEAAKQWHGWGTALKPAWEPIIVARNPIVGTVAANVLKYGAGAMNVDGCRVGTETIPRQVRGKPDPRRKTAVEGGITEEHQGRWPANLIHDGSEEVLAGFPDTGPSKAASRGLQHSGRHGGLGDMGPNIKEDSDTVRGHDDLGGSAARFFYCAKASKADRDEGCEGMPICRVKMNNGNDADGNPVSDRFTKMARNTHCCVKPTALMRYLCKLVTPPNGMILDPFMGSGSTGKAAILEGFNFIGIEMDAEYCKIARARIAHV